MKRISLAVLTISIVALAGVYVLGPVSDGQNVQVPSNQKETLSFRHVVKRVAPSVVSIETELKPGFVQNLPVPFDGLPAPKPQSGFGSGFLADANGVVVTNNHVVRGAGKVIIKLHDGRKFTSKDFRGDAKSDLAVILLDTKGKQLPFLKFGNSNNMEIGDRVLAFGAPFGLTGSVTSGIVSAKGRRGLKMNMYEDFLQTDAAINPGNSGGPLVNLKGNVVGINAAIKTRSGGFQGVGLAVGSSLAKGIVDALVKEGEVRRAYLGVEVQDLTAEIRKRLGLPKNIGVVVSIVLKKSPAAKAGILPGDVLISIDAKSIVNSVELQLIAANLPIQRKATIELMRDGKKRTLSVLIERQPKQFGLANVPKNAQPNNNRITDQLGIQLADLTAPLANQHGYPPNTAGVALKSVKPGGIAWQSGLRVGMLVSRIDRFRVVTAAQAEQAFAAASLERGVLLQVRTAMTGTRFILVQSGP